MASQGVHRRLCIRRYLCHKAALIPQASLYRSAWKDIFCSEKIPAQSKLFIFGAGNKAVHNAGIRTNPFGGTCIKKRRDKLNPWQSQLFPLSFTPVIFHRKGYVFFIHADDPMVADRNAVGIFAEIFDHGIGHHGMSFCSREPTLCHNRHPAIL